MHEELSSVRCTVCGRLLVTPEAWICGNCGNEDTGKMTATYCHVFDEEDD